VVPGLPDDAAIRSIRAIQELAALAIPRDPALARSAERGANTAIALLNCLRLGLDVPAGAAAMIGEAIRQEAVPQVRLWRGAIVNAGKALQGREGPWGQHPDHYEVVLIVVSLMTQSFPPTFAERLNLMTLAEADRVEDTAALLQTCVIPGPGDPKPRSKKGKKPGAAKARQWQAIAVELLIRAGLEPATMTKTERKRCEEKIARAAKRTG
jgi:hypothetical protein